MIIIILNHDFMPYHVAMRMSNANEAKFIRLINLLIGPCQRAT